MGIIVLSIAFVIGSIATFIRMSLFTIAGERIVARMRRNLFQSIMEQEIGFFDVTRTGELMNRLSADTVLISALK
jgi:ABC-type multidrug transport system fused ATPase/permease subunit